MKYIMILTLSFKLLAAGHNCEAICININSAQSILHILSYEKLSIGVENINEAHGHLLKRCQKVAKEFGLYSGTLLVDKLDYFSSHYQRTISTHFIKQNFFYSRRFNREQYLGHSNYFTEQYNELDINMEASNPNIACKYGDNVISGKIPYLGKLKLL